MVIVEVPEQVAGGKVPTLFARIDTQLFVAPIGGVGTGASGGSKLSACGSWTRLLPSTVADPA